MSSPVMVAGAATRMADGSARLRRAELHYRESLYLFPLGDDPVPVLPDVVPHLFRTSPVTSPEDHG